MKITRKTVEKVLNDIVKIYGEGARIIENWDWLESGPTRWAIVWDDGPFEWAYNCTSGADDLEAYGAAEEYLGRDAAQAMLREGKFRCRIADTPGVFLEPVTFWAIGLYPA